MIVPGTVFGTVGALAAFPLRLAQREVERRHAELRRGITRRTSHVLFGRTLLARVGLAKAGEAEIARRARAERAAGRILVSENGFLRLLGLMKAPEVSSLSRQSLIDQSGLAADDLDLLSLFDAFEHDGEPYSFRDLILARKYAELIACGATLLGAILGTLLGFLAAHVRGTVEQAILALVDFQATMPFLILALAILAFIGNSLVIFMGLLALHGWERYARIARGLALSANAQGYAGAVWQLGASPARIYLVHILPNVMATLIVSMTIAFPEIVLVESGLSFLGLGVQPPATSLGSMVGYGRDYLATAPWILIIPAATISLMALSVSLVWDWLRDRFERTGLR